MPRRLVAVLQHVSLLPKRPASPTLLLLKRQVGLKMVLSTFCLILAFLEPWVAQPPMLSVEQW